MKADDTDPVINVIHSGSEEVSQEVIDLFYVDNPGEQDPVEDTCQIVD